MKFILLAILVAICTTGYGQIKRYDSLSKVTTTLTPAVIDDGLFEILSLQKDGGLAQTYFLPIWNCATWGRFKDRYPSFRVDKEILLRFKKCK